MPHLVLASTTTCAVFLACVGRHSSQDSSRKKNVRCGRVPRPQRRGLGMTAWGMLGLFAGFDDLDVVVVEEVAGGVIHLRDRQLIVDLGEDETLLGIRQLDLSVQYEEYRL